MSEYKTGDRVKIKPWGKDNKSGRPHKILDWLDENNPGGKIVTLRNQVKPGMWRWGGCFGITDKCIDHIVTRDTQYIDKRFERMDKLKAGLDHIFNEAAMFSELPF